MHLITDPSAVQAEHPGVPPKFSSVHSIQSFPINAAEEIQEVHPELVQVLQREEQAEQAPPDN